jgi:hypothetical protein
MEPCSSRFGGVTKMSNQLPSTASLLSTQLHALHRADVGPIQERLRGANGDAFLIRMHKRNESFNGLRAVIASKVANLR